MINMTFGKKSLLAAALVVGASGSVSAQQVPVVGDLLGGGIPVVGGLLGGDLLGGGIPVVGGFLGGDLLGGGIPVVGGFLGGDLLGGGIPVTGGLLSAGQLQSMLSGVTTLGLSVISEPQSGLSPVLGLASSLGFTFVPVFSVLANDPASVVDYLLGGGPLLTGSIALIPPIPLVTEPL